MREAIVVRQEEFGLPVLSVRKLGHVVLGSTDLAGTERFFIEGVGFKISDSVAGLASFLRCSKSASINKSVA